MNAEELWNVAGNYADEQVLELKKLFLDTDTKEINSESLNEIQAFLMRAYMRGFWDAERAVRKPIKDKIDPAISALDTLRYLL